MLPMSVVSWASPDVDGLVDVNFPTSTKFTMTTTGEAGVIQAASIVTSLHDAGSSCVGRGDNIDISIAVRNGWGNDVTALLIGPMVEVGDTICSV